MARGSSPDQIGVTREMAQTYGDAIFRMSNNIQVREGDPIRELDFDAIERQREGMGLSDAQIADRIGLTRDQVMFIRNTEEVQRQRIGKQACLLELGGSKRFRVERVVPLEERFRFGENALRLREAMKFDAERTRMYIEQGWWRNDTLPGWLARDATGKPNAPAVIQGASTMTWTELSARVERFAEGLRQAGVARGEVVAVQLPNIPEFLIAYLAICRLGAVMTTLHMPYRDGDAAPLLLHSRAAAVICLDKWKDWEPAQGYRALQGSIPSLRLVIALGEPVEGALSFSDLVDSPPQPGESAPLPVASDPFLLLYTSGTTSAPKGVPHNYHTMLSNGRLGAGEHRITSSDRVLSAAPFTHLFGLYSLHVAWSVGAPVVLLPVFSPQDLVSIIEKEQPTALFSSPAHIAACRALGLLQEHDISALELVVLSGSACPEPLVRWFQDQAPGCCVSQLFGMTETQAALYTRRSDPPEVAATSAGRPSPGMEARILGAEGVASPAGEEGELQVRGCSQFPGFFDNEPANAAAFTPDGWYRTGDLAVQDEQGNIRITGRQKDIINRGGIKFNPCDIEALLDSHPKILQSAIVPMHDPILGERACCFVTLRPGADPPVLEELVEFLMQRQVAKIKLPERLEVIAEMPLTPTRKIIKGLLRIGP
jgi:acyl-coenzyme A synthetase/AMP-(fatty) acid ligase